jgi:hypothetical protein
MLRLAMGFSSICCELQQIRHFHLQNLLFKLIIKIKLTMSNFSFSITIHTVFEFVDSKSSLLVTIGIPRNFCWGGSTQEFFLEGGFYKFS